MQGHSFLFLSFQFGFDMRDIGGRGDARGDSRENGEVWNCNGKDFLVVLLLERLIVFVNGNRSAVDAPRGLPRLLAIPRPPLPRLEPQEELV